MELKELIEETIKYYPAISPGDNMSLKQSMSFHYDAWLFLGKTKDQALKIIKKAFFRSNESIK